MISKTCQAVATFDVSNKDLVAQEAHLLLLEQEAAILVVHDLMGFMMKNAQGDTEGSAILTYFIVNLKCPELFFDTTVVRLGDN